MRRMGGAGLRWPRAGSCLKAQPSLSFHPTQGTEQGNVRVLLGCVGQESSWM